MQHASPARPLLAALLLCFCFPCSSLLAADTPDTTLTAQLPGDALAPAGDAKAAAQSLYDHADSLWKGGSPGKATQVWQSVVERFPDQRELAASSLYKIAKYYCKNHQYAECEATINQLNQSYPDQKKRCDDGKWVLAEALVGEHKVAAALAVYKALEDDPANSLGAKAEAAASSVSCLYHEMKHKEAFEGAKAYLKNYPGGKRTDSIEMMLLESGIESGDGDSVRYVDSLLDGILDRDLKDDRRSRLMLYKAFCVKGLHGTQQAIPMFQQIIAAYPKSVAADEAKFHIAIHNISVRTGATSEDDIRAIGQKYLRNYALGYLLYKEGRHAEALPLFASSIQEFPKWGNGGPGADIPVRAMLLSSLCWRKLGDQDRARQWVEQADAYRPAR